MTDDPMGETAMEWLRPRRPDGTDPDVLRVLADLHAAGGWAQMGDVIRQAAVEIERLREWIDGADHQPGCSGGYDGYRCKCGKPDEGSDRATTDE